MKRRIIASLIFLAPWTLLVPAAQAQKAVPDRAEERIQREVRHEVLMLPYFNVFEDLNFKVEGGAVTLSGEVTQPITSRNAEAARHLHARRGFGARLLTRSCILQP